MSKLRNFGLRAAAGALLLSSVSPAYADRGWGGGGPGWGGGGGWGHRERHDDTAEILGGFLLGAVVIGAIAAASSKSRPAQRSSYPDDNQNSSRSRGDISSEDQAVDACANAAESKGGRTSSVRNIDKVNRSNVGWEVDGVIEMRRGWRDDTPDRHRFNCSVRYGSVDSIYIEDGKTAYAY